MHNKRIIHYLRTYSLYLRPCCIIHMTIVFHLLEVFKVLIFQFYTDLFVLKFLCSSYIYVTIFFVLETKYYVFISAWNILMNKPAHEGFWTSLSEKVQLNSWKKYKWTYMIMLRGFYQSLHYWKKKTKNDR